jgi:hypothetical protein
MKLNLSNVEQSYTQTATLNANFDAIEGAIENTLSRDGTTPNEMNANIDMNDNSILNVNALDVESLTIAGIPVSPALGVQAEILASDVVFMQDGNGAVQRSVQDKLAETVSVKDFGAVGDGVSNDYAAFVLWAAEVNSSGNEWVIPQGNYLLNGPSTINLRTGGKCFGTLIIPKNNHSCRIVFERDSSGTILNTSGWTALNRGSLSANALNAAGKYINIGSTLTLIERDGNPANPYLKQEFIRVEERTSNFTTPLVHTYGVPTSPTVVVTAYAPSRPIIVDNLRIVRRGTYGGTESYLGCLRVERDNATFNNFELINENQTEPLAVGVDVIRCADVVFNSPRISGLQFAGTGYGINLSNTIGFVCNNGTFIDCRHCISGRHNVDVLLNGGNYAGGIDDHWGDRMVIDSPVITVGQGGSAIQYAGNDIIIRNPVQINGRNLLSIRADTPQLGGNVQIINPKVITKGEAGFYYMFGFTSPDPTQTGFTTLPRMPDSVVIENPSIDTTTALTYIQYLGWLKAPHINWGDMRIVGNLTASSTTQVVGIFMWKDATYQTGRSATITVDGPMDFGSTGVAAYAASINANDTLAATVYVSGMTRGNLRYSPYSVKNATISNSGIGYIENDNNITVFGNSLFTINNCQMLGGYVSASFRNIAFYGCTFTGTYTAFPYDGAIPVSYATMVGNTRTIAQPNLPPNLQSTIVSPFVGGPSSSINPITVPLTSLRNADGSGLSGTGTGSNFGSVVSFGTNFYLKSANASSSTVTSNGWFEIQIPAAYVAGSNFTVTVNAEYDGGGTLGATRSLTMSAYKIANDGSTGANIIATPAATFGAPAADYTFTVTGTTLSANDRISLFMSTSIQETGGGSINSRVNSVRVTF